MRKYFFFLTILFFGIGGVSQKIIPYSVPEAYSSDYYLVTGNGQPVQFFTQN